MHERQNILVVEDNPEIRNLLIRTLSAEGFHLFSADNGEATFAILGENEIDLVLLDFTLPGRSGLDILTEIRTCENRVHHRIPVIMLSTEYSMEDIDLALAIGADSYLLKPFQSGTVIKRVQKLSRVEALA